MPQHESLRARFNRKVALTGADVGWFAVASVGLALALMVNGVYDGVIFGFAPVATFASIIDERPFTGGLGYIVGCALLAVPLARSHRQPRYGRARAWVLAAFLGACLTAMLGASAIAGPDSPVALLCGTGVSVASIVLLAFWLQALARAGRPRAFAMLAAALLIDTLFDALVRGALVDAAGYVAAIAGAVASPLLLAVLEDMDCPCATSPAGNSLAAAARSSYDTPFWVSVAFIAVAALVMGNVQSLGSPAQLDGALGWVYRHAVNIGAVAAALLALGVVTMRSSHANMRAAILVTLMLALYCAVAFGSTMEPLGRITMTAARMSIVLYIFLLACDIPWRNGWPMFAFVVGWGVFTLANTTSTRLGLLARGDAALEIAYDIFAILALVALAIIELRVRRTYNDATVDIPGADDVALAVAGDNGASSEHPAAPASSAEKPVDPEGLALTDGQRSAECSASGVLGVPGSFTRAPSDTASAVNVAGNDEFDGALAARAASADARSPEDPLLPNCRAVAEKYGLTARELEVLVPLVHGRSAATIAGLLGMSVETARTHIRHIYAKTDIHCREDLMDEVEGVGV